jgi:hypothetical protein
MTIFVDLRHCFLRDRRPWIQAQNARFGEKHNTKVQHLVLDEICYLVTLD